MRKSGIVIMFVTGALCALLLIGGCKSKEILENIPEPVVEKLEPIIEKVEEIKEKVEEVVEEETVVDVVETVKETIEENPEEVKEVIEGAAEQNWGKVIGGGIALLSAGWVGLGIRKNRRRAAKRKGKAK